MISEGSCDTEDWSYDAENSALHQSNKLYFKIENSYFNVWHYFTNYLFYCKYDQINVASGRSSLTNPRRLSGSVHQVFSDCLRLRLACFVLYHEPISWRNSSSKIEKSALLYSFPCFSKDVFSSECCFGSVLRCRMEEQFVPPVIQITLKTRKVIWTFNKF